jgi:hypothetical protein
MRCRLLAHLSVLVISILVLAACGGSGNAGEPAAEHDPTSTPGTDGVAQVTSTASGEAPTGTPMGDGAAQAASPASGDVATGTLPGGLVIATAPDDETIVKNVPTEPPIQQTVVRSNFDADEDGFYTFEELEQAVAALYPSYQWPDNYQVDPNTLLSGFAAFKDQGARFQAGSEYTVIGMRHQCAWEMAWLDGYREGDTALMDESLNQLRTVALENPMFIYIRDDLENMIQRAELGDPALMQRHVDANCRSMKFITPVPEPPPADS